MILIFILLVFTLQIALYFTFDKRALRFGKPIVLGLVITGHLLVFPLLFKTYTDYQSVNYAIPGLSLMLSFWAIGGSISLLGHLVYQSIFNSIIRGEKSRLKLDT